MRKTTFISPRSSGHQQENYRINHKPFSLGFSQQRRDVSSKLVGVTHKGATASRLGREETSQEEEAAAPLPAPAPAGEVAPQAPRPAGAPSPSSLSARTTTLHSTLQTAPEVQLRLRVLLPPDPSQLSSTESSRPERGLFRTTGGQWRQQGWASPSQAHSTPPRPGPGGARLRDGEGELAPLPPPYLPY